MQHVDMEDVIAQASVYTQKLELDEGKLPATDANIGYARTVLKSLNDGADVLVKDLPKMASPAKRFALFGINADLTRFNSRADASTQILTRLDWENCTPKARSELSSGLFYLLARMMLLDPSRMRDIKFKGQDEDGEDALFARPNENWGELEKVFRTALASNPRLTAAHVGMLEIDAKYSIATDERYMPMALTLTDMRMMTAVHISRLGTNPRPVMGIRYETQQYKL